jgi:hypothetical protein
MNKVYKSPTEELLKYPTNAIPMKGASEWPEKWTGSNIFIYDPDKYKTDPEYRKRILSFDTSTETTTDQSVAQPVGGIGTMQAPTSRVAGVTERGMASTNTGIGAVTPTKVEKPEITKTQIGVTAGLSAIGEFADSQKNLKTNEYLTDVDYWQKQGKWWFDKNADYAPTLAEYSGNMPSAIEAINPTMNVLGGAAKGAATGMAIGGPVGATVGAGVGALVGVVESIFGMSSAKKQDAKNKERTINEYNQQLKEWTYARNKRFSEERAVSVERQQAGIRAIGAASKEIKKEKAMNKEDRRQALIKSFLGAGLVGEKQRTSNIQRWA